MKNLGLGLFAAVCMQAVGCAEGPIDRPEVLRPGREMTLAYHFEMQIGRTDVERERHMVWPETATQPHLVIKRIDKPSESVELAEADVNVSVASASGPAGRRVTMEVQRFLNGGWYTHEGEKKEAESWEFRRGQDPTGSNARLISDQKEFEAKMRDGKFLAVVDPNGLVESFDVEGEAWKPVKRRLAEEAAKGESPAIDANVALGAESVGVIQSLADCLAYIPPHGVRAGGSWQVRRQRVLPYHWYGYAMLTQCGYAREETTCTLESVLAWAGGSIATVAIRGKRFPVSPDPNYPMKDKYFDLSGRAEINLTTDAIEKLHLVSTAALPASEADRGFLRFVETMSLKPRR